MTTRPREIDARERARLALAMRREGATLEEIVRADIGYGSKGAVSKAISRLLARNDAADVAEYRALEEVRLDWLWRKTVHGIKASEKTDDGVSPALISAAVRISDRRARLLGLDAPTRVDLSASEVDLEAAAREIFAVAEAQATNPEGHPA